MNWYYAESGQQRGPVSDPEFNQLVSNGVIRAETLVWNETLANWQPWSSVAPAGSVALESPVSADGRVPCARCQQLFGPEDLVDLSGRRVCGSCKPIVLQQMQEGLVPASLAGTVEGSAAGSLSVEEFLTRDYTIDAPGAVSEAWGLMFGRSAVVWLGCLLLWAAFIGAGIAMAAVQLIPILGILISTLFSSLAAGLLEAGNGLLFVRERRGEPNDVSAGFKFFGPRFWQVALTHLPHAGFQMVIAVGALFFGFGAVMAGRQGIFGVGGPNFSLPDFLAGGTLVLFGLFGLVFLAGLLYVATCLRYAPLLALDKGYSWRDSIRISWRFVQFHFWQNFWLLFLSGVVMLSGICACVIGGIVSYPLAYGMTGVVFDRHFRDLAPAPAD